MNKTLKTKESRIEVRLRPQDKLLLKKAADAQGLSISSYVVHRSLQAAQEDAAPYRTYEVSRRDAQMFLKMLENPPPPNEKLKAAVKRYQTEVS